MHWSLGEGSNGLWLSPHAYSWVMALSTYEHHVKIIKSCHRISDNELNNFDIVVQFLFNTLSNFWSHNVVHFILVNLFWINSNQLQIFFFTYCTCQQIRSRNKTKQETKQTNNQRKIQKNIQRNKNRQRNVCQKQLLR